LHEIDVLWREHLHATFPADCVGRDINGVDLVSLDTYTAGCISTYQSQRAVLGRKKLAVLQRCCDELESIEPQLAGDAREYFARLLQLARLALNTAD
jgi:hypothetical protein